MRRDKDQDRFAGLGGTGCAVRWSGGGTEEMKVADKTELYYAEAHALQPNGRSRTRSTKTRTLNVKHVTFNAQRQKEESGVLRLTRMRCCVANMDGTPHGGDRAKTDSRLR